MSSFLFAVVSGIALLQAALLFLLSLKRGRSSAILACWAIGLLLVGLSNLGLALRPAMTGPALIMASNGLLALSYLPFSAGVYSLRGKAIPRFDAYGWVVIALAVAGSASFSYFHPSLAERIVVLHAAASLLSGRIAMDMTSYARTTSRSHALPAEILAALIWFLCIATALTAILVGSQGELTQDLFQAGPPSTAFLAMSPVLIVVISLVAIWLDLRSDWLEQAAYLTRTQETITAGVRDFRERCDALLAGRSKAPLTVMAIDLDNFKQVWKQKGHVAADQLLAWSEQQIRAQLRSGDSVERCGHDQFVVLMPGIHATAVMSIAERIRRDIEQGGFSFKGAGLATTVSIGLAMPSAQRATGRAMLGAVKAAIDVARVGGRNRVETAVAPMERFDITQF